MLTWSVVLRFGSVGGHPELASRQHPGRRTTLKIHDGRDNLITPVDTTKYISYDTSMVFDGRDLATSAVSERDVHNEPHLGAISDSFVRCISTMCASDLPPLVVAASRRRILDALGDVLGSVCHDTITRLRSAARRLEREGSIPLPGGGDRFGLGWAARIFGAAEALGVSQRSHDSGSTCRQCTALAVVWCLAATEQHSGNPTTAGAHGARQLAAFACGIEAQFRIRRAIIPRRDELDWDTAGVVGVIGAAMTATAFLGGNEAEFSRALGIAASMTIGLGEMSGSSVGPFHVGQACANGVQAAFLARDDFWVSPRVLEADRGYFSVLFGRDCNPSIIYSGSVDQQWLFQQAEEASDNNKVEDSFFRRTEPLIGSKRASAAIQCISGLGISTELNDLIEIFDTTS